MTPSYDDFTASELLFNDIFMDSIIDDTNLVMSSPTLQDLSGLEDILSLPSPSQSDMTLPSSMPDHMLSPGLSDASTNVSSPTGISSPVHGSIEPSMNYSSTSYLNSGLSTPPQFVDPSSPASIAAAATAAATAVVATTASMGFPNSGSLTADMLARSSQVVADFSKQEEIITGTHIKTEQETSGISSDCGKMTRKQIRAMKNRESAALSRQKKKAHTERLEMDLSYCKAICSDLETKVASLQAENAKLRSRNVEIENAVANAPPVVVEYMSRYISTSANHISSSGSKSSAGIILCIVLLTFSLFTGHIPFLKNDTSSLSLLTSGDELSKVAAISESSSALVPLEDSSDYNVRYTGRTLQALEKLSEKDDSDNSVDGAIVQYDSAPGRQLVDFDVTDLRHKLISSSERSISFMDNNERGHQSGIPLMRDPGDNTFLYCSKVHTLVNPEWGLDSLSLSLLLPYSFETSATNFASGHSNTNDTTPLNKGTVANAAARAAAGATSSNSRDNETQSVTVERLLKIDCAITGANIVTSASQQEAVRSLWES